MKKLWFLALLATALVVTQCSKNDDDVDPEPTDPCANKTVTYTKDIKPILETKCNSGQCHGAGAPQGNWTSFATVKAAATNIRNQVSAKTMPKAPNPALSQAEIDLFVCWVKSGTPE